MRIILEVTDDKDLDLALQAARKCMRSDKEDMLICYGDINTPSERSFWIKRTKTGWSSRRLYRHDGNSLTTG